MVRAGLPPRKGYTGQCQTMAVGLSEATKTSDLKADRGKERRSRAEARGKRKERILTSMAIPMGSNSPLEAHGRRRS